MTPQLFDFNNSRVRVMTREDNSNWFLGNDVCEVLGYGNPRMALSKLDTDEKVSTKIDSPGGKQSFTFINESGLYHLIFGSNKPEAGKFRKWVTSEVLPALRQTGNYSFRAMVLPEPTKWEKTFPDEFMRQVLRLHGYEYDSRVGTPSWVGHFINKYIYNYMDKKGSDELKEARNNFGGMDESAFLHQFLNGQGKGFLKDHLVGLIALLKSSQDPEHFEKLFNTSFRQSNQLQIGFRNKSVSPVKPHKKNDQ